MKKCKRKAAFLIKLHSVNLFKSKERIEVNINDIAASAGGLLILIHG